MTTRCAVIFSSHFRQQHMLPRLIVRGQSTVTTMPAPKVIYLIHQVLYSNQWFFWLCLWCSQLSFKFLVALQKYHNDLWKNFGVGVSIAGVAVVASTCFHQSALQVMDKCFDPMDHKFDVMNHHFELMKQHCDMMDFQFHPIDHQFDLMDVRLLKIEQFLKSSVKLDKKWQDLCWVHPAQISQSHMMFSALNFIFFVLETKGLKFVSHHNIQKPSSLVFALVGI